MKMKIFDLIKMANDGDLFDGAIMEYNDMEFEFNGVRFVGRKNDYYFPYTKLFDSDFLEEEVDLFYEEREEEYVLKMPNSRCYIILNMDTGEIHFREQPWNIVDTNIFKYRFTRKEILGLNELKHYKNIYRIPYSVIRGL